MVRWATWSGGRGGGGLAVLVAGLAVEVGGWHGVRWAWGKVGMWSGGPVVGWACGRGGSMAAWQGWLWCRRLSGGHGVRWACGRVGMSSGGHVVGWACGRVGMWACPPYWLIHVEQCAHQQNDLEEGFPVHTAIDVEPGVQ